MPESRSLVSSEIEGPIVQTGRGRTRDIAAGFDGSETPGVLIVQTATVGATRLSLPPDCGVFRFFESEGYHVEKSHILAHDAGNRQPICVYRCDKGGVHVFYGYVNVGMPPEHFRRFTQAVLNVLKRITEGDWDGYVTLHYGSTSLILAQEDFVPFAGTIREAAQALEVCEANQVNGQCEPEVLPDNVHDFIFQSYDRDRLN